MSFCETCRETVQFYESDGLFYCSQCDGQSETMQVMEYSHFESQPSQSSYTMRARTIKRSTASKTKVPKPDETPDEPGEEDDTWSFAEVFQLILKKQVDALIKLGITNKLKEVVEVMWFRYLRNSKWAFVPKQSNRLQLKGKNGKSGKKKNSTLNKDEQEEVDMVCTMFIRSIP
ncbi:TATA box-binding protein-associated factor RNA polymerase I subunit B-like [Lytechinus pictus]|uniref:TATA box-binding protein-associated factor RNA polymerase I subunit B-like n=1 Tax=Lytechinus pictus TaxID=7653 RepID=UPI0030BA016E